MKASELRIGNWIQRSFGVLDKEVRQEIADILIIGHAHLYQPIPLTEEWLLKFGFETRTIQGYDNQLKCWYIRSTKQDYFEVEIDDMTTFVYESGITTITKHVHQLQNLYFALTGEELTIKE